MNLDPELRSKLEAMLEAVIAAPIAVTAVRDRQEAWHQHIEDSLSCLALHEFDDVRTVADIGAGAGFPGLVVAAARPTAQVWLIESIDKKVRLIERLARLSGLQNATGVTARVEEWPIIDASASGRHQIVTAKAVAPLAVLLEYAAPLLMIGGSLVAWKGEPDLAETRSAAEAAEILGLQFDRVEAVVPFAGSRTRRLFVYKKLEPTPSRFPRRAGMATKRPLGSK